MGKELQLTLCMTFKFIGSLIAYTEVPLEEVICYHHGYRVNETD